jgi:hypothetical protein
MAVDVRRGWVVASSPRVGGAPGRAPPRSRELACFAGNSFWYVETSRNVVKRREVTGLAVVVDRTVYSGLIGRFMCD